MYTYTHIHTYTHMQIYTCHLLHRADTVYTLTHLYARIHIHAYINMSSRTSGLILLNVATLLTSNGPALLIWPIGDFPIKSDVKLGPQTNVGAESHSEGTIKIVPYWVVSLQMLNVATLLIWRMCNVATLLIWRICNVATSLIWRMCNVATPLSECCKMTNVECCSVNNVDSFWMLQHCSCWMLTYPFWMSQH